MADLERARKITNITIALEQWQDFLTSFKTRESINVDFQPAGGASRRKVFDSRDAFVFANIGTHIEATVAAQIAKLDEELDALLKEKTPDNE